LKVTLGQNMKVKVNHKRVSLPFVSLGVLSVVQEGYSVVVRTNLGEFPVCLVSIPTVGSARFIQMSIIQE
jgi:hypothetical protein